ncbi:hypothetical protein ASF29_12160 [Rhizobium sp. Leaf262]|nr:hypothetical protein ASF29_12160 [Rhizobium sp. Leaf262]
MQRMQQARCLLVSEPSGLRSTPPMLQIGLPNASTSSLDTRMDVDKPGTMVSCIASAIDRQSTTARMN